MPEPFPPIPHLPGSPGAPTSGLRLLRVDAFLGVPLVMTEKLDGSNLRITREGEFPWPSIKPRRHPSYDMAQATWLALAPRIPPAVSVFGEWMHAKLSIAYDRLPDYFMMFGVRDDLSGAWWSWERTQELAGELGVPTVPLLWSGTLSEPADLGRMVRELAGEPSNCGALQREGLVVRWAGYFGKLDKAIAQWVSVAPVPAGERRSKETRVRNMLAH